MKGDNSKLEKNKTRRLKMLIKEAILQRTSIKWIKYHLPFQTILKCQRASIRQFPKNFSEKREKRMAKKAGMTRLANKWRR